MGNPSSVTSLLLVRDLKDNEDVKELVAFLDKLSNLNSIFFRFPIEEDVDINPLLNALGRLKVKNAQIWLNCNSKQYPIQLQIINALPTTVLMLKLRDLEKGSVEKIAPALKHLTNLRKLYVPKAAVEAMQAALVSQGQDLPVERMI